ncbi:MAG: Rrf2 family transcriptional regulator [Catonella sp.]|nr:Rrf2 family transcriptional regulator [Catonella sp.]
MHIVSPTYLQKILGRLVKAGIVNSTASKEGGYTIAKRADEITIADIMDAVDETKFESVSGELAANLFGNDPHVGKAEKMVEDAFHRSLAAMRSELAKITVEDLLEHDREINGSIDWEERLKKI